MYVNRFGLKVVIESDSFGLKLGIDLYQFIVLNNGKNLHLKMREGNFILRDIREYIGCFFQLERPPKHAFSVIHVLIGCLF